MKEDDKQLNNTDIYKDDVRYKNEFNKAITLAKSHEDKMYELNSEKRNFKSDNFKIGNTVINLKQEITKYIMHLNF